MATDKERAMTGLPVLVQMLTGGLSACIAEVLTIPLDTAKVRLQLQSGTQKRKVNTNYKGVTDCIQTIVKQEGPLALYTGLIAGFQRQIIFASIRLGTYNSVIGQIIYKNIRDFYQGQREGDPSLGIKIISGLTTGVMGILVSNPTEVIKVRFQGDGNLPKDERRYKNVRHAYKDIFSKEGMPGFYWGFIPNIIRNSIINCVELATYDQVQETLINRGIFEQNFKCHLVSSTAAGVLASIVGQPIDLIKNRIMNQNQTFYQCTIGALKQDGLLSFYNGLVAQMIRITGFNIIMFVVYGQMKIAVYRQFYKKTDKRN